MGAGINIIGVTGCAGRVRAGQAVLRQDSSEGYAGGAPGGYGGSANGGKESERLDRGDGGEGGRRFGLILGQGGYGLASARHPDRRSARP